MWETIFEVVGLLLAIAAPFVSNWLQNKARDMEKEREREEQIERDEEARKKLEQQWNDFYRRMNSRLNDSEKNVQSEIEKMRRGE